MKMIGGMSPCRQLFLLNLRSAVVDTEGVRALEGALHLTDDAHGGLAVGTEADSEVLGILGGHALADLLDAGGDVIRTYDVAIDLYLPLTVELAYVDIDDGGAIGEFLHLSALRHLAPSSVLSRSPTMFLSTR